MKKNPGRRMRRQFAAMNRKKQSGKKQAINEQKLLHFSNMNGPFKGIKGLPWRSLNLLKGATA